MSDSYTRHPPHSAVTAMDDEEDEYTTRLPTSARIYGGVPPPPRNSNRLPVPVRGGAIQRRQAYEGQPAGYLYSRPRLRIQLHPLTSLGIVLLFFVAGWWLLIQIGTWWQVTQDDWHYGRPRTFQTDAVVGHHDSIANPSHFIAINLNRHILIYEIPGGDASKTVVYRGPTLIGQEEELVPVTLKFQDMNGDGKPDMILVIGESTIVYLNTGSSFKVQNL